MFSLLFCVGITHNIYVYLAIGRKTTTLFRLFSFNFMRAKKNIIIFYTVNRFEVKSKPL